MRKIRRWQRNACKRGDLFLLAVPGLLLAVVLAWNYLLTDVPAQAGGADPVVELHDPDRTMLEKYDRRRIAYTGKLRLVGSGRSPQLVVTSDAPQDVFLMFADRKAMDPFIPHQGRRVRVEGLLVCQHNEYPNPIYNHTRFLLYEFQITDPLK